MKLNKIATAVSISLAALALTACGSDKKASKPSTPAPNGGNNPGQVVDPDKALRAQLEKKAQEEGQLSSDKAMGFVNKYLAQLKKDPAQFGKLLAEYKKELDDQVANQNAGKNTTLSPNIASSNPFLTGFDASINASVATSAYVRAEDSNFDRRSNSDGKKNANSGEPITPTLNYQNPYLSNFLVGVEGIVVKDDKGEKKEVWGTDYLGEYVNSSKVKDSLDDVADSYTYVGIDGKTTDYTVPTLANRYTIQEENKKNVEVEVVQAVKDVLKDLSKPFPATLTDGDKTGLLITQAEISSSGQLGKSKVVYGEDESKTKKPTRVFGKNYQAYESGSSKVSPGSQVSNNSYKAIDGGVDDKTKVRKLDIKEIKLENVQYGRLTAQVDALHKDPDDKSQDTLIYRPFVEKGKERAVDFYFYRGTDETTIDQMKVLQQKEKGATLTYHGHALTYGVDPVADSKYQGSLLPNSFGQKSSVDTIGNFVEVRYTIDTGKVEGSIYNFAAQRNMSDKTFEKQNLINFSGSIEGNTVGGEATRVLGGDKGSFYASFYGPVANEMGGNITSVTKQNGYGEGKWGAVFGAQRDVATTSPSTGGGNWSIGTQGFGTTAK